MSLSHNERSTPLSSPKGRGGGEGAIFRTYIPLFRPSFPHSHLSCVKRKNSNRNQSACKFSSSLFLTIAASRLVFYFVSFSFLFFFGRWRRLFGTPPFLPSSSLFCCLFFAAAQPVLPDLRSLVLWLTRPSTGLHRSRQTPNSFPSGFLQFCFVSGRRLNSNPLFRVSLISNPTLFVYISWTYLGERRRRRRRSRDHLAHSSAEGRGHDDDACLKSCPIIKDRYSEDNICIAINDKHI